MTRVIGTVAGVLLGLIVTFVGLVGAASLSVAGSSGDSSQLVQALVDLGYANGRLPDDAFRVVSTHGGYLCQVAEVGGAVDSWLSMVSAARLDGVDIEGGWCYRTFERQVELWTSRQCFIAGMCDGDPYPPTATPGTSNHGWGLAVDVWGANNSTLTCASTEFGWMKVNAARFGWSHPGWASCGQPGQEPWHWEFSGISASANQPDGVSP